MIKHSSIHRYILPAAFIILSAAVFAAAQNAPATKHNQRPPAPASATVAAREVPSDSTRYSYEFSQPEFAISHILIEHDSSGRGRIRFSQRNTETPWQEPLELSAAAISRISSLWQSLNFLDSTTDYQSDKKFAHLGTMRLQMEQGTRKRTAEFNWTNNSAAAALVSEYRRAADQAILVFDIAVARESQPLNSPKLMEYLQSLLKRNGLSDPKQLLPLLREVSTDEHLPLIARNHALRLIKQIDK